MTEGLSQLLQQLREDFDLRFVRPYETAPEMLRVVLVREGSRRWVIRDTELMGVYRCPALTPVPSSSPALLGLAEIGGALVAAYGLAAMLTGASTPSALGRWLVVPRHTRSVGLVFEGLDGIAEVPPDAFLVPRGAGGQGTAQLVKVADETLPVVVPSELVDGLLAPDVEGESR